MKTTSMVKESARRLFSSEGGGAAIILVVWVMVILVAIVGEFSYTMRTEINIIRNFKEEEEAYQVALAGIEAAKYELMIASSDPGGAYMNDEGFLILTEDEEEPERSGTLGKAKFEYTITDEESKFNINTFQENERVKLERIFSESGVEYNDVDVIIDSLLDWKDNNELHRLNGAEEDYYTSLDSPYSCKDRDFEAIEELLLVKGMTKDILYGSVSGEDEELEYSGVIKYLTVNGDGKINVNTAPAEVLEAVCGTEVANSIMQLRETGPIPAQRSCGKAGSSFFSVISTGTNQDGSIKRSVKAVLKVNNKGLETVFWRDNVVG